MNQEIVLKTKVTMELCEEIRKNRWRDIAIAKASCLLIGYLPYKDAQVSTWPSSEPERRYDSKNYRWLPHYDSDLGKVIDAVRGMNSVTQRGIFKELDAAGGYLSTASDWVDAIIRCLYVEQSDIIILPEEMK